jgi:multicomponent Na+:H+ antiporter subunit F
MMALAMPAALLVLVVALGAGLLRLLRGPTAWDRMVGVQFATTGTVAALLLLALEAGDRTYVDVALVVALFAAVAGIALVQRPTGGA